MTFCIQRVVILILSVSTSRMCQNKFLLSFYYVILSLSKDLLS